VSSAIIMYGGLALVMLRGALIYEIQAQRASRRRLEQELHRALTCMLATMSSQTATAVQNPDDTAVMRTGRGQDSRSVTVASARETGRM
jgi:hypothetical protein